MAAALVMAALAVTAAAVDYTDTAQRLLGKLTAEQFTDTSDFRPPEQWQHQQGIFQSDVLFNLHGKPLANHLRRSFVTPDINAFVTIWVTQALLELHSLGVVQVDSTVVENAVDAVLTFKDKNHPGTMIQTFWPEKLVGDVYNCHPQNIIGVCNDAERLSKLVLDILQGTDEYKNLQALLGGVVEAMESFKMVFPIPADFDDTFCNLGLGGVLAREQDNFPKAYASWLASNNPDTLWDTLLQYSYQPFSSDPSVNIIDPRTYFFMREFLQTAEGSLILPTTWVQSIDENRKLAQKGVTIPFNINNVDASVSANVLYGLTSHILETLHDLSWFNSDLQQLYRNTTNYIAWTLESNMFAERPDLGLMYYPDPYAYIWFTARTARLLNTQDEDTQAKLPPVVKDAQRTLTAVLRGPATIFVINNAHISFSGDVWWEQWLGAADTDELGVPQSHHDDRMFTTGAALNNLLEIWTLPHGSNLTWAADTPPDVTTLAMRGGAFINATVLANDTLLYNAFFSGSVKGRADIIYAFPANFMQFLNGTEVGPDPGPNDIMEHHSLIVGVQGLIDPLEYEQMLSQLHFGMYETHVKWDGFNTNQFFPFWSAEPLTLALNLAALVKLTKLA
eukprot:TRINITY_DN680_c0_g1_i4.p1 TRINITY_DN680_c0_g1~~TRINITY_DN680_c0_g1_i4.p1  ORF type:complete len:671 (-),score=183.66 TRINITY_DN680_c0_g1_i4:56-1915(-)